MQYVTSSARLDAVPPQHQKMRRKALRLLLRHTDAAVEELRDDDDEMLRGGLSVSILTSSNFETMDFGVRVGVRVRI